MTKGEGGVFMVNSKPMIDYFPRDHLQNEVRKLLSEWREAFVMDCVLRHYLEHQVQSI